MSDVSSPFWDDTFMGLQMRGQERAEVDNFLASQTPIISIDCDYLENGK